MADDLWVMITAVVIAVGVMMISAGAISDFVEPPPDRQDPRPQLPPA